MATFYHEADVDPSIILGLKVGIIGYGSQGHAHALNLRDSGVTVRVGLHAESKSREKAEAAGFDVPLTAELTQWADVLMFCTADVPMGAIYRANVEPNLKPGQTILFAHGFNILYNLIQPPANVNVAMVSPKGPGHGLRAQYLVGKGLAALVAVHHDATGQARDIAFSYAWGIGSARVGILMTTFKEETETDLFGEQSVLCGGIPALINAGFETLVAAGYQPEVAYFECLHEAKLITDLLYEGGLTAMRQRISDTAEWGGYEAGSLLVNDQTRETMRGILERIQDGSFTRDWVAENEAGLPRMKRYRVAEKALEVESVGREVRAALPTLGEKQ